MNEQRQQAYFDLIQSLLNCPSGEEPEILAANQDLLDAGFLQAVEAAAQMFSQQGDENTANWLQGLASYLRKTLNQDNEVDLQSLSEEEIQAYFQFLTEVLQATKSSVGDAQVVYPLLAKHTDKLNGVFAEILRCWGTNTLGEVQADEAEYLAAVIVAFSSLIQQFPDEKASSIEIAITGYEIALTVYTCNANPQDWARIQNGLGNAYSDRVRGDRAENLERAIAAYEAALTVFTRDANPQKWATIQNSLGIVYRNRMRGDSAENIERAIAAYEAALTVFTCEANPQNWTTTQNNLGAAYYHRILGERADNIEQAINAYEAALEVITCEADSQIWAGVQNNLGNAYSDRILGDKGENLEYAIAAYEAALIAYTRDANPQGWAMVKNNLGTSYNDRILGDRAENLEKAIEAYTAALEVRSREAFPQEHAETLFNLGLLYQDANQFTLACSSYASAIATIESLREEIISGEENKRKQAEYFNRVYSFMVEVCLKLGNVTEAIEYVERSKNRNLVEPAQSR
jgi:tetratricopeptide (TPR) repeat protein